MRLSIRAARRHISLIIVALSAMLTSAGLAECQDVNVHISPRDTQANRNPSAQESGNHFKPFCEDVDLILVPATVTDSMDRLVTGLDKDNFAILSGQGEGERPGLSGVKIARCQSESFLTSAGA